MDGLEMVSMDDVERFRVTNDFEVGEVEFIFHVVPAKEAIKLVELSDVRCSMGFYF